MLYSKQNTKIPKKINEKISKFSYYVDTFFPDLFNMKKKTLDQDHKIQKPKNQLLTKEGNKNLIYNYFYSQCPNSAAIDSKSILRCVKKLYLNQDVIKINDMSYSRQNLYKQSYLPVYGFFSEIIDFVIITDNVDQHVDNSQNCRDLATSKSRSNLNKKFDGNGLEHSRSSKGLSKPKQYWVYVIHNCNSFKPESDQIKKIAWQHFIERYHFTDNNIADPESIGSIEYELIYSYKHSKSFFSFQEKITQGFVQSHCKMIGKSLESLEKLQGYLLQTSSEVLANQKIQDDVAFSSQHKRQNKIPVEHYKHYLTLKKQIYKYFLQLNGLSDESETNKYFYDNLICRYLIARQYHFDQARKSIKQYLKWQKQMKQKYPSLQNFKEIHAIGAYRYLGEDFMGRPIILSKSALVDVTKMPTTQQIDKYCDYYIYFLEIYLRTKMRGYVDQMIVVGDLTNLGSNNFKLAITKRNVSDSLKYGPQRQYALITVNVSTFAYTAWTFIKPLLPKKTLHKIQIIGNNKKDIVASLSGKMDIKVIPEYLGGQNKILQTGLLQDNQQQFLIKTRRTQSANLQMQKGQNENCQQFGQIQLVTARTQVQQKKSTNGLFSIFETVTKSLGINIGKQG